MMNLKEIVDGDRVQLTVEGRVDATTAPQLQNAILTAFQKGNNVSLDCAKLEYISSAGLRALLLGQKTSKSKGGSFVLMNIVPEVMEIFEVTGFDDILTIQ